MIRLAGYSDKEWQAAIADAQRLGYLSAREAQEASACSEPEGEQAADEGREADTPSASLARSDPISMSHSEATKGERSSLARRPTDCKSGLDPGRAPVQGGERAQSFEAEGQANRWFVPIAA